MSSFNGNEDTASDAEGERWPDLSAVPKEAVLASLIAAVSQLSAEVEQLELHERDSRRDVIHALKLALQTARAEFGQDVSDIGAEFQNRKVAGGEQPPVQPVLDDELLRGFAPCWESCTCSAAWYSPHRQAAATRLAAMTHRRRPAPRRTSPGNVRRFRRGRRSWHNFPSGHTGDGA